ncbi:MAG TPA: ROK family protein [Candidatus Acidoferrales bacterium]|jgi:predicted NBD/HSP70 family sugar kinase|nr:ROK family protein [Candidatus Acidoferrales bacterium]
MRKIDLTNFQVATSETARDINSRIILNLVRKYQSISRADLMRQSGLQRSTVSVITEQLISEQWLREGAMGASSRGRRPTFLHLNENRAGIFGINIQPVSTDLALANLSGHFLAQETIPTPRSSSVFVTQISSRVREWMKTHTMMAYEGIGVSLPGRVDLSSQKFVFAPNLSWHAADLKEQLEKATGLSVSMENAANACALSEFWFGKHADGINNLVVVTVSEGIGVGMILNGQLVRGSSGLAGEFGHVALSEDGPLCGCGNRGCWEVYASNSAAVRYYNEAGTRSREAHPVRTFGEILQLNAHGDPRADKALDRMAEYLGKGLAMVVAGLAPDMIIIVGDVAQVWGKVGPIVADVVRQRTSTHASVKIMASGMASLPRLRGIIALVLQRYFGVPAVA